MLFAVRTCTGVWLVGLILSPNTSLRINTVRGKGIKRLSLCPVNRRTKRKIPRSVEKKKISYVKQNKIDRFCLETWKKIFLDNRNVLAREKNNLRSHGIWPECPSKREKVAVWDEKRFHRTKMGLKPVVPIGDRLKILIFLHKNIGHWDLQTTRKLALECFWWPNIQSDVTG